MKDDNRIRIGVIGCASIADRYVIPAINELSGQFALEGIASRDKHKAQDFADRHHTRPFASYESLINSGLIDAVYIPLPNSLHRQWIEKALGNNLHVLVEKPLVCSYDESIYLNNLAESRKLVLLENFQFRFHRQMEIINNLLHSGAIGELRYLRSTFGFPPFSDPANIRYQASLGGGALFDAGAYTVRIAQYFLGSDLDVSASCLKYDSKMGIDLWGGALLVQQKEALFAEIAFGFDFYYQCKLELVGNKGIIIADRIFTSPPGYSPIIIIETKGEREERIVSPDNHFINMLLNFYGMINGMPGSENEYRVNINQARLIEQIRNKADGKQ